MKKFINCVKFPNLTLFLTLVLSLLIFKQANAAAGYSVKWLGLLDDNGNISMATGINNSGQVTGWSGQMTTTFLDWSKPFKWDKTTGLIGTGTLGGPSGQAWDINDAGVVVGWAHGPYVPRQNGSYEFAFHYDNGIMTGVLGTIAGQPSHAFSINNIGNIVGERWVYTGSPAFLFDGTVHELQGIYGAYDINDLNVIAGTAGIQPNNVMHAITYDNGVINDLGTLGGNNSWAWSINNSGQIAGWADDVNNVRHAFLYSNGIMTDLSINGEARAINNLGHVVGYANGSSFLYKDGTVHNLNDLIPPGMGTLYAAIDINDKDEIVGYGLYNNIKQAFVLTPNPPDADLSVTQTDAPDPLFVTNILTYTVTVTNNGPGIATGVKMIDTLPAGVNWTLITTTRGSSCVGTTVLTCTVGNLAIGEKEVFTIKVKTTLAGTINNKVDVTSDMNDPVLTNNTSTVITTVKPKPTADLAVSIIDEPDPAIAGGTLVYKITVTNNGPGIATQVKLYDTLSAGVRLTGIDPAGICTGTTTLTCNVGKLLKGGTYTLTILTTPLSTGIKYNTAKVTGFVNDLNTLNNKVVVKTTVQ